MAQSRKLTKKDLKKDAFRSTAEKVVDFAEAHANHILIAVGAVIVLVGASWLYLHEANKDKIKASVTMQNALKLYKEAEDAWTDREKVASSPEKFKAAKMSFDDMLENNKVDLYTSSSLFYSAKISYQQGKYDEAIEKYQRLVKEHPKTMFALQAQKAIGLSYEQKGGAENLKKAISEFEPDKYRPFSQLLPYRHVLLEAYSDKGRCYEKLKDQTQAIQAYKYIFDQFKNNLETAIKSKRERLLAEAKELAKKSQKDEGVIDPTIRKNYEAGVKYEAEGKLDEALESYNSSVRLYRNLKESSDNSDSLLSSKIDKHIKSVGEFTNNLKEAEKLAAQDQFNSALFSYKRAVDFDFPPSQEVLENAQFQLDKLVAIKR